MPYKIKRNINVEWTPEEFEILRKAYDLCSTLAEDEEMEDWAQENCREGFGDVAGALSDFIDQSI